ncbi:hypothetical protein GGS21DRAFT_524948, partial [Xylaria nigripes]
MPRKITVPLVFPACKSYSYSFSETRKAANKSVVPDILAHVFSEGLPRISLTRTHYSLSGLPRETYTYKTRQALQRPRNDTLYQWLLSIRERNWGPLKEACSEVATRCRDDITLGASIADWIMAEAYNFRHLGLGNTTRMNWLARSTAVDNLQALNIASELHFIISALETALDNYAFDLGAPITTSERLRILIEADFHSFIAFRTIVSTWPPCGIKLRSRVELGVGMGTAH